MKLALIAALTMGALLVGILGFVWLSSNAGCATLSLDVGAPSASPTPEPPAFALNQTRVRNDAPQLAALLDRALHDGRATESHPQTARAEWDYLQREAGGARAVEWRGTTMRASLAVC